MMTVTCGTALAEYCAKTIPPLDPRSSNNGRAKMVVMFVDWPDRSATEPVDTAAARQAADEVDDWYQEQSMCRMGIDFVIIPQHVRMPKPTSEYPGGTHIEQIDDAVHSLQEMTGDTSYNYYNYHTFIMDYPVNLGSAGLGGPGRVWARFRNDRVLRHEIAHAVNIDHEDQPEVDIGRHITPYGRYKANWISSRNTDGFAYKSIMNTDTTGAYCDSVGAIRIHDIRGSIEVPNGFRMLRVSNPRKTIYYKVYAFYDAQYSSVALYVTDLGRNPPVYRFDFTPNSNSNKLTDYEDGGLKTGDSYFHDTSGIRITVVNTTAGTATEPGYADISFGCEGTAVASALHGYAAPTASRLSCRGGRLEVRFDRPMTGTLTIRDLQGRTLQSFRCHDRSRVWSPSLSQRPGTYIVEVRTDAAASWAARIVVGAAAGR